MLHPRTCADLPTISGLTMSWSLEVGMQAPKHALAQLDLEHELHWLRPNSTILGSALATQALAVLGKGRC